MRIGPESLESRLTGLCCTQRQSLTAFPVRGLRYHKSGHVALSRVFNGFHALSKPHLRYLNSFEEFARFDQSFCN